MKKIVKKTPCIVDNFTEYNETSVQLYHAIHEYAAAGYSNRAIAKKLHCSRNTVCKYLNGDYESLCRRNYRSGMDQFYDYIIKELSAGISRKDVYYRLIQKGLFFASTFSSKMQIDFLKVAWGISPVLHFPLRHSFRCRRGAVAGIQSLLVTDM